jgi:NADPH-dependent curcumin reductase CurA
LRPDDFRHEKVDLPPIGHDQFLVRNEYFSLDAGFRKWMSAGTSDNYLAEMPLGKAVQSIVLGQVIESRNPRYPAGAWIMGRAAWERYSIVDGSDLMTILAVDTALPIYEYLAALGTAGLTAYFGLTKIGLPKRGDVLLVNAAGGGVGSLVGQLGKLMGCTTIGISSTEERESAMMSAGTGSPVISATSPNVSGAFILPIDSRVPPSPVIQPATSRSRNSSMTRSQSSAECESPLMISRLWGCSIVQPPKTHASIPISCLNHFLGASMHRL